MSGKGDPLRQAQSLGGSRLLQRTAETLRVGRGRPAIFKSPGAFQGLVRRRLPPATAPRRRDMDRHVVARAVLAGERPALADKHPILAAVSGDPCRSTSPTLLQRRHHSVTSHRCSISLPMVSSVRIEGDDPSGATRPTLRRRSELRGGDNGITGTELMQVPSRFRRTYLNRSSEGSGRVTRGSPVSSACAKGRLWVTAVLGVCRSSGM